jgi:uncharacterized phage-associated protein
MLTGTRQMADIISPSATADFLLTESRERGEILTNLKLQKLLYYAQAWYLALNDLPLFQEEMEAWVHGPVLPTQYYRFRSFQWKPIVQDIGRPTITTAGVEDHLNEIIDVFGTETAVALELMTHNEQPWIEARGNLPPDANSTNRISKNSMRDYYRSLQ